MIRKPVVRRDSLNSFLVRFSSLLLCLFLSASFVSSCAGKPVGTEKNGVNLEIFLGLDNSVKKIRIKRNGSGSVYAWNVKSAVPYGGDGVEITDINFDGNADVRVCRKILSDGTRIYANKIFDPSLGDYKSIPDLDALRGPVILADEKKIICPFREKTADPHTSYEPDSYSLEIGSDTFEWIKGVLVNVKRSTTTYYSETEMCRVAEYISDDDGVLDTVSEKWYDADEYLKNGNERFW